MMASATASSATSSCHQLSMLRYRSVRKVSVWVLMCVRLLECVHAIAWVSKAFKA